MEADDMASFQDLMPIHGFPLCSFIERNLSKRQEECRFGSKAGLAPVFSDLDRRWSAETSSRTTPPHLLRRPRKLCPFGTIHHTICKPALPPLMLMVHSIQQFAILPILRIPPALLPIDYSNNSLRAGRTRDHDNREREIAVGEKYVSFIRELVAAETLGFGRESRAWNLSRMDPSPPLSSPPTPRQRLALDKTHIDEITIPVLSPAEHFRNRQFVRRADLSQGPKRQRFFQSKVVSLAVFDGEVKVIETSSTAAWA